MTSAYKWAHDMDNGYIERPHDKTFQFYNNVVLVSYIDKSYFMIAGDTIFLDNRVTKTFLKIDNQWKMISSCLSRRLVNYTKPGHSNPALYHNYVGIYQESPTVADTILLINGKLYIRTTTDSKRSKLFSLNDSTFMSEDYPGKIIFARGAGGKVTCCYYEFNDGQRVHIPKVK